MSLLILISTFDLFFKSMYLKYLSICISTSVNSRIDFQRNVHLVIRRWYSNIRPGSFCTLTLYTTEYKTGKESTTSVTDTVFLFDITLYISVAFGSKLQGFQAQRNDYPKVEADERRCWSLSLFRERMAWGAESLQDSADICLIAAAQTIHCWDDV